MLVSIIDEGDVMLGRRLRAAQRWGRLSLKIAVTFAVIGFITAVPPGRTA